MDKVDRELDHCMKQVNATDRIEIDIGAKWVVGASADDSTLIVLRNDCDGVWIVPMDHSSCAELYSAVEEFRQMLASNPGGFAARDLIGTVRVVSHDPCITFNLLFLSEGYAFYAYDLGTCGAQQLVAWNDEMQTTHYGGDQANANRSGWASIGMTTTQEVRGRVSFGQDPSIECMGLEWQAPDADLSKSK